MKVSELKCVRLPLEGAKNVRDLGGYATNSINTTKWNSFLRGDDLSELTDNDINFLYHYGVRTVIDLRSEKETQYNQNPLKDNDKFDYYNISLASDANLLNLNMSKDSLNSLYIDIISRHDLVKELFLILANAKEGGILYHCTAGKDRTGVVSMLLLSLAGVYKNDIMANYEVSNTYLSKRLISEFNSKYLKNDNSLQHLLDSPKKAIECAIEYLESNYGDVYNYLKVCGISDNIIDKIRERLY